VGYGTIIAAIHSSVDTELVAYAIQHENENEADTAKPNESVWVRASVKCGDSGAVSIGTKKRWKIPGVLFLSIFAPVGSGVTAVMTVADLIIAAYAFKRIVVGDTDATIVRFHTPTCSPAGRFGGQYQMNAKCVFEFDVLK
jgi:hypothetical protein